MKVERVTVKGRLSVLVTVVKLSSGTYINGLKIQDKKRCVAGDIITLGESTQIQLE